MKEDPRISRRRFMAAAGGTIVSIGLPGVFVKLLDRENNAVAAELRTDGRPRIPPGQHAVKALPDMGGIEGPENPADWRLQVTGEIENPVDLTYRELINLKQEELVCDVHCVTGWTLLDARWRGVRLQTILDLTKAGKNVGFLVFEAPGGYSSSIPIDDARKHNVMLAHTLFDQKLPLAHGAPVRGLVPDRYFYKSVKWVNKLRVVVRDEPGYWERMGYSNSADPWKEERFGAN